MPTGTYRHSPPDCHPERKHASFGLCNACYKRKRYHENGGKEEHARWVERNKEHLAEYQRAWTLDRISRDSIGYVLARTRTAARKRGLTFSITRVDLEIVWTMRCPVLGIGLTLRNKTKKQHNSLSVDRVDARLGYVPGNIRVISWRANQIKLNASVDELEALVKYLRKVAKRQVRLPRRYKRKVSSRSDAAQRGIVLRRNMPRKAA